MTSALRTFLNITYSCIRSARDVDTECGGAQSGALYPYIPGGSGLSLSTPDTLTRIIGDTLTRIMTRNIGDKDPNGMVIA